MLDFQKKTKNLEKNKKFRKKTKNKKQILFLKKFVIFVFLFSLFFVLKEYEKNKRKKTKKNQTK